MKRSFGLIALLASLVGCGSDAPPLPELGLVKGKVTLDGKPVPNASIIFTPMDPGLRSFGRTDESGQYELTYQQGHKGAAVGPHTVRIRTGGEVADADGNIVSESPEIIPERYHGQMALSKMVEPGENPINFDLTSK